MEGERIIVKNAKSKIIVYVVTIILSALYIGILCSHFTDKLELFQDNNDVVKAKITEIVSTDEKEYQYGLNDKHIETIITFKAKAISGKEKNKTVTAKQQISDIYAYSTKEVKKGKTVILKKVNYYDDADYLMTDYVRSDSLIILSIIFVIFLLIFGKIKGLNTIISLIFTCLAIFLVFIPAILSGGNIYFWSIITCIYIIVMTLLLINNFSKKTICACIGCFLGIIATSLLTISMTKILDLTGLINEEAYYIQTIDTSSEFDLKAIIFGGIIIGAVGAIMDVAVSISASLLEVYEHAKKEDKNFKSLMKSGMIIGRDMMGTMSNTLVMAYIGNSLSTTLLLVVYSGSVIELFNREMIIVELLQILVGSFGLLLTIPFSSFICSYAYTKFGGKHEKRNTKYKKLKTVQ